MHATSVTNITAGRQQAAGSRGAPVQLHNKAAVGCEAVLANVWVQDAEDSSTKQSLGHCSVLVQARVVL